MAVKKIGELLVESGLITKEQLDDALSSEQKGVRLGSIIVKKGYATEIDIAQTLSFQLNIPFVDIGSVSVDPEAVKLINERLAKKYLVFPLYQDRRTLKLSMADPLNLNAIDDIRFSTGLEIMPCSATLTDVTSAINRYYHLNEPIEELIGDLKKDKLVEVIHESDTNRDLADQVKKSAAPPIIKMVDSIIIHAVDNKASDIHIEPQEKNVKLRLRIDGLMRETMQLPKWVQGPVVSRIKLMAKMDIAERRVSQDGRLRVRIGDRSMDVRVSTLPTQYGETVVMRLLDPKSAMLDLKGVGLLDEDYEQAVDMIDRPQGVVLVTGPTGSGKTSTLYAMLAHIKSEKINIITIEDPIEYELKDVNQVAINDKTGLTFSYTLRSVLRQDPDVILVGEMRDTETAIIAHQASLTGHLVFSTLHTNDAISSVIRLKNMGVPSYMVASALNGVAAQRLVRMICSNCKEEYTPAPDEIKRAGVKWSGKNKLYRGAGCKQCNESGYAGRIGVFELLPINNRIKGLIAADSTEQELLKAAIEAGYQPLHIDGLKKVAAGITTLEELTRVIYLSREDEVKEGVCPLCMKGIVAGSELCPHCGGFIAKECPSCGKSRQPEWVICPFCATRFNGAEKASHLKPVTSLFENVRKLP
ncbi:MAG: Flp pilus assembly complex ATPase component TadA [Deltaproteobacteria bacterium]|nr:Flp pilus assembly complex ATPase component TadA [Deltaproteobacteria bacterium]